MGRNFKIDGKDMSGRGSGIPIPIMPTENIGMMSGAIRKKRGGRRRDERGSARGRRFSKVTQFDGSTKVDTGKIMSKEEYEADATRRINEGIKRGIQMSPVPYSMYLERQKKKQDGSTPKIGIGDFEQNQAEKINEAIARQKRFDSTARREVEITRRRLEDQPGFDPNKPSAVQETTRVNVQDPTLGGPPEREVPLPKEKDMTPRGPAPFAPNERDVAKQRFFETMFERAANRKERSGIDKGEMRDRQEARRDEAAMRGSERGRGIADPVGQENRRGNRNRRGRRMRRRDFTRKRSRMEGRRSREERAAFRDRYVSTLGSNFFS